MPAASSEEREFSVPSEGREQTPKITGHRLSDRLIDAAQEDAEGRAQTSHESQLWDALEEAENDAAWPPTTGQGFRDGYRAGLRHALAVVTDRPVPRDRPEVPDA